METNVLRRSMPVSPLCQQEGAQVGLPRAPALHAVLHTLGPMPPPHPRVIQPAKPPAPAAKATPALFWVAVVMVAFFFIKSEAARAKGLTWWGKAVSSKTDRFLTGQKIPVARGQRVVISPCMLLPHCDWLALSFASTWGEPCHLWEN